MNKPLIRLIALATAVSLAGAANAAAIISDTATFTPLTAPITTFDGYDSLVYTAGAAGINLDDAGDVLLTTVDEGAVLGAFAEDLSSNGLWGARFEATPTGTGNFLTAYKPITFSFGAGSPQAQVGAFFNHTGGAELTLTAYAENGAVLESFVFAAATGAESYNQGLFLGFARTQADIYSFGVSVSAGNSLVMDDLRISMAPIPEPGTLALLLGGLGLVGFQARRRAA